MEKFKKAVTFSYDDGGDGDKKLVEIFNKLNILIFVSFCGTLKKRGIIWQLFYQMKQVLI